MEAESDEALYAREAKDLVRFATGLVGPDEASDIVQSAVVRCITSRHWSGVGNRRAYLYRAVVNEARMLQRSRVRRQRRETRAVQPAIVGDAYFAPDVDVRTALERLSTRQRAVIVLTYWADLAPAAVANLLGITEGSVRRHLARARACLREVLNGE